ncbi:MAG: hypothetical protein GY906_27265 [bacterium]|nr:hypothetical protein [bacterium]
MRKSILYTLFGFGRLPKKVRFNLEGEGIVLVDEGLRGSITLRKFRAPGRFHSYRKSGCVGSLVVTEQRFAAFAFRQPVVDVPLNDPHLALLELSVPRKDLLRVKFDAGAFNTDWSGSVECRFSTSLADEVVEKLTAAISE